MYTKVTLLLLLLLLFLPPLLSVVVIMVVVITVSRKRPRKALSFTSCLYFNYYKLFFISRCDNKINLKKRHSLISFSLSVFNSHYDVLQRAWSLQVGYNKIQYTWEVINAKLNPMKKRSRFT